MRERFVGQFLQFIEHRDYFVFALFRCYEHHLIIVLKAELAGRFIAQPDEFDYHRSNRLADHFTRFPGFFTLGAVGFLLKDLDDIVIGNFFSVDGSAECIEFISYLRSLIYDLFQEGRIELVGKIAVVEDY